MAQDAFLTDPNNPEYADISRQRKLAEMLTLKAFEQPQGNMVSGRYVAPSFTQQLAPLISGIAGQAMGSRLDEKQLKLVEALRAKGAEETQKIIELAKTDPNAALAIASNAQTSQARAFAPSLMSNLVPKTPDDVAKFKYAQTPEGGGFKGSYNEFMNQITPYQQEQLKNEKIRLGIAQQEAANKAAGGNLTEFQGKATNYGVQMAGSINEMAAVENAGFNPASTKNQTLLKLAGTNLGNMVVSPEAQRYKQGMDNFTENFIRFKSGANVPMSEIEKDLKNMMPQVGDTPDKINQKQRARERALQGMSISAGPGAKYIMQAYQTEAPAMLNENTSTSQKNATPSLWGKATVVRE
jgi:hypothetical protein